MTPTASQCPSGEIATASGRCPTGKISTPWGGVRVMSMMLTLSVSPELSPMLPTAAQRRHRHRTGIGADRNVARPWSAAHFKDVAFRDIGHLRAIDAQEGDAILKALRGERPLAIWTDRHPGHARFALGMPHLDRIA